MVIAVAGKNDVAVQILEYLYNNNFGRYELRVICNKNESGKNSWQRSVRHFAIQHEIPECKLEDVYGVEDLIFLSLEFDRIIKPHLFKSNRLYNIHFSLLPQYKGMYTSALPILHGEKFAGVTFHKIDKGIDTGDIIAQKKFELLDHDTCRDVYFKFIELGTALVLEQIENVISGVIQAVPQPAAGSTYFSKDYIDYSNVKIDLKQTAEGIGRQIRAFTFREYQLPEIYGEKIIGMRITNTKSVEKPGEVVFKTDGSMLIATIDYNLVLHIDRFDELLTACGTGDIGKVREICSAREHVNQKNVNGWTPLMVATYHNHLDVVEYLLTIGADPYAKNNNGTNLLMYAKDAYVLYGKEALLDLYLSLGVPKEWKDYRGKNLTQYVRDSNMDIQKKEYLYKKLGAV